MDIIEYTGPQDIFDFTGYRKIKVRKADPEMVDAQPNCCIDNSIALSNLDQSLEIVQGFIQILPNVQHAVFHYWNYDPEYDIYYDCSPIGKATYWIKE